MKQKICLDGDWLVFPIPLGQDFSPDDRAPGDVYRVPACGHLQPLLYPNNPYWGKHIRQLNDFAWIYSRSFSLPDDRSARRVRLRFEGVDYFASVWVNGQIVGQHEGHFAPFEFDVTDLVRRDAENTLLVRVTSPWDEPVLGAYSPADRVRRNMVKGLYEHSEGLIPPDVNPIGIWQPVWLLLDDAFSIDHVRIRAVIDGTVNLCLRLTNATEEMSLRRLIISVAEDTSASLDISLPLSPGTHDCAYTLHVPDPRLWWCWDHGEASLYTLNVSLCDESGRMCDAYSQTFGFRSIELERSPDRFLYVLNGREIYLRGISYLPDIYLSRCNEEQVMRDMLLVRDAGLNLVRLHVHVSLSAVYEWCDRNGILIWQDFELNWLHEYTPEFEVRARRLQAEMIDLLDHHPSIITWACHNEPTMVYMKRQNLEQRPDPALYADAKAQDPTRPVFICSGQMDDDWMRSGDSHPYYGAIWSKRYTDVYAQRYKLVTEFGVETPAAIETLLQFPEVWNRLSHLAESLDTLWNYQAELARFHIEHFRRIRSEGNAGYIYFWLNDLVPQVGCGVLDSSRRLKGGYSAVKQASAPLHIALEHDGCRAYALWVFNDTAQGYENVVIAWNVSAAHENQDQADATTTVDSGSTVMDIQPNASQRVCPVKWSGKALCVELTLLTSNGDLLASNTYRHPFNPMDRPQGYPWNFDHFLGCKVYKRPDASSLIQMDGLMRIVPGWLAEQVAEWGLRRRFPPWLLSIVARLVDRIDEVQKSVGQYLKGSTRSE